MSIMMNVHAVGRKQVTLFSPVINVLCVYNLGVKKDATAFEKGSRHLKSMSKNMDMKVLHPSLQMSMYS